MIIAINAAGAGTVSQSFARTVASVGSALTAAALDVCGARTVHWYVIFAVSIAANAPSFAASVPGAQAARKITARTAGCAGSVWTAAAPPVCGAKTAAADFARIAPTIVRSVLLSATHVICANTA